MVGVCRFHLPSVFCCRRASGDGRLIGPRYVVAGGTPIKADISFPGLKGIEVDLVIEARIQASIGLTRLTLPTQSP